MLTRLLRRLGYLARQRRQAHDLDEELAFHREMLARHRSPGDGASRAMGNVTLAREDARAVWIGRWLDEAWQDVRYAARSLSRQSVFSLTVIVIVGLGAGSAMTVFGLLDALVIRSLPVERPDRLVWFSGPAFSYPVYREVKARLTVLDGVFGWNLDRSFVDWTGRRGELQATDVLEVTPEFFATLRVGAAVGRTFGEGETDVAVITHAAWKRHFGSDPSAVGRVLLVGNQSFVIVGVAPAGFAGVAPGVAPEVVVPIAGRYGAAASIFTATTSSWLHLMARVKDGVSLAQAEAALQAAWPAVIATTVDAGTPSDRRAMYLSRRTSLEPGRTGYSPARNQFANPLWLLMALTGVLLAAACASVANLLLARGVARRREIAVRLAIGAGRWRVFRQIFTEALVLTSLGVAAGVALAAWGGRLLVTAIQSGGDRFAIDTTPGWRTLSAALLATAAISLGSTLLPGLQAARRDVVHGLKGAVSMGPPRRRWSGGWLLVATQVGLAVVLLAGAAVLGRSLARVLAQDTGIDAANVLVVSANAAAAGYTGPAQRAFHLQVLERIRQAPGVEAAALSWMPPISTTLGNWTQSVGVDGGPLLRDAPYVYFNGISPGYFSAVGMRLRRGRDLADTDTAASRKVVVINESLARQFFPGQDPIGRRITIGRAASRKDLEIVGVVHDAKYRTVQEPTRNIAYLSIAQVEDVTSARDLFLEVRAAGLPAAAADARRIVREIDARVPVGIETVADRIRASTLTERLMARLAAALGGAALVLACAGLYGMLAYSVSRRRAEIGIRIALGARRASLLWMIQRQSLSIGLAGVVAGLGAAIALARFVNQSLLFQVSPTDPAALGSAGAIMLIVAAAAAYVPARRAAALDPVIAMKTEG